MQRFSSAQLWIIGIAASLILQLAFPQVCIADEPGNDPFPGTVSGRVVDFTTRHPVAGARVSVSWEPRETDPSPRLAGRGATCDQNGLFRVTEIPEDRELQIRGSGAYHFWCPEQPVRAGDENVELVLERGSVIRGWVQYEKGMTEPDARVWYRSGESGREASLTPVEADDLGAFQTYPLHPGTYRLSACCREFITGNETGVTIGPGEMVSGVKLVLVPGGVVRVRARHNLTGDPVEGVFLNICDSPYVSPNGRVTDKEGIALLGGLPSGEYEVCVGSLPDQPHPFYISGSRSVVVKMGETTETEVLVQGPDIMRGTVVDANGVGIPGATVSVGESGRLRKIDDRYLHVPLCETVTREDGSFEAPGIRAFSHQRVEGCAAGYLPQVLEKVASASQDVRIELVRAGTISGRITDSGGEPVAGARIVAYTKHRRASFPTSYFHPAYEPTSDVDGFYRIERLLPGFYDVDASKEPLGSLPKTGIEVAAGGEATGIDFVLTPGFSIYGKVVEKGTDIEIPGVRVRARGPRVSKETTSDEDGHFSFEHLQPGEYKLSAWAGSETEMVFAPSDRNRDVIMLTSSDVSGVRLELSRYASIRGRVVDPEGNPVAGALMRYSGYGEGSSRTQADGTFHLMGVYPREETSVTVEAEGFPRIRTRGIPAASGQTVTGVEIRLPTWGTVKGRTRDTEGNPVAGVKIEWQTVEGTGEGWSVFPADYPWEVYSAADGSYLIEYLLPAKYRIRGSTEIGHHYFPGGERIEYVEGGGTLEDVDFIFNLPPLNLTSLRGMVVNEEGEGIRDCHITKVDAERPGLHLGTSTDEEGRFSYEEVFAGTHALTFDPPRPYAGVENVVIVTPTDEVRIVLKRDPERMRLTSFSGVVLDAGTGGPIQRFEAVLTTQEAWVFDYDRPRGNETRIAAKVGGDGSFEFDQIPDQKYHRGWYLHIEAPGYVASHISVRLEPGAKREGVEYRLERAGSLVGEVVAHDGQEPIEGASVTLFERIAERQKWRPRSLQRDQFLDERSGSDGRFAFDGVPAGTLRMSVGHPEYASEIVPEVTVVADATARVKVSMHVGGTVEGRITDHEGNGLVHKSVNLHSYPVDLRNPEGVHYYSERTDRNGDFVLRHVYPGKYLASVSQAASPFGWRLLEVKENEVCRVDFAIPFGAIAGVVTRNGRPAHGCVVEVAERAGWAYASAAVADTDGAYRFEQVPAGPLTLRLVADKQKPRVNREVSVTLEPDEEKNVDLELPSGSISGAVVSEVTGGPIPGARLMLLPRGDALARIWRGRNPDAGTDSTGGFTLADVPGGDYILEIVAREYGHTFHPIRLEEGEVIEDLRIPVGGGGSIEGKVVPPAGKPVEDMWGEIRILYGSGPDAVPSFLGETYFATGEFRISNISAGTYTILAGGRYQPVMVKEDVIVAAGETTHVEMEWPSDPVYVSVALEHMGGTPIGLCVALLSTSTRTPIVGIAELLGAGYYGTFQAQLPRGVFQLHVEKAGYSSADVTLDLRKVPDIYETRVELKEE